MCVCYFELCLICAQHFIFIYFCLRVFIKCKRFIFICSRVCVFFFQFLIFLTFYMFLCVCLCYIKRDSLRNENSELRSQLSETSSKLRKLNSDTLLGQHQNDDSQALRRRIDELEVDLRNAVFNNHS